MARRPPVIMIPGAGQRRTGAAGIELTQAFDRTESAAKGRSRLLPPETTAPTGTGSGTTVVNNTTSVTETIGILNPVNTAVDYTASAFDQVRVDATAGDVDITLPSSLANQGKLVSVKKTDSSANLVWAVASGSDTIWSHPGSNPIGFQHDALLLYASTDGVGGYGWDVL